MVVKKQRTVVTGPATPAPAVASRTNSSQTLAKNHKGTTTKAKPATTLSKNTLKTHKTKRNKSGNSLLDSLLIIVLSVFVLYTYNFCSSANVSEALENPLCRSLYRYKTHVVDPYILPPLQSAYQSVISHPTVDRQLQQIQPYVERVKPHVQTAAHYTERTYSRIVLPTWNDRVIPISGKAWSVAASQYQKNVHPHVRPYIAQFSKHLEPYTSQIYGYSDSVSSKANKFYTQAQPHINRAIVYSEVAYIHGKRYASIILDYTNRIYVILRPHVLTAYKALSAGTSTVYSHGKPLVVQGYDTYVDPHLQKIWEKVVELSGKRDPYAFNGNGNAAVTSLHETKVATEDQTKASTIEETSSASVTATDAPTTTEETVVEAAPTPEVPEEPSVPSPSVTPTSSEIPTQAQTTEELASASSVVADRAPPSEVRSSLEEEITASASSVISEEQQYAHTQETETITSSVEAQESITSSSSSAVPTQHIDSGVVDEKVEESNTAAQVEDDLDSFLSDLGVDDSDVPQQPLTPEPEVKVIPEQEQESQTSSEDASQTDSDNPYYTPIQYTPEQIAENAAKRKALEARHSEWERKTAKLLEQNEKDVRNFLGAIRDLSSNVVAGKKLDPKLVELLESRVDLKAVTEIEGVALNKMLNLLEKEAEKLLVGLEGWVKREEANDASKTTVDEKDRKLAKLEQLLGKVRERFQEKVNEFQEKVHFWYRNVKEIEANECLRLYNDVKGLTDDAQADIGMDYAWLEGVSVDDWQRYHDLMRAHEHFDKTIRYMQNPTQNDPPPTEIPEAFVKEGLLSNYIASANSGAPLDPLNDALNALGEELDLLALGWEYRLGEVAGRGRDAVKGPEPEQAPVAEDAKDATEDEPVKILPISPAPPSPEVDGVPDVPVIGKSREQVEQAFKIAQEAAEGVEKVPIIGKSKEQVEEAVKAASVGAQSDEL